MHGLKAKTLKRMLKKAGLKTSGKKATLTKRAKSAHLMGGADGASSNSLGTAGEFMPVGPQSGGAHSFPGMEGPGLVGDSYTLTTGGRRRHTMKTKELKRMLKKAGLKCSGRKAALTKRARSAHLIRGGA
jgi:hypothetical protein